MGKDAAYSHVMAFVAASDKYRQQFVEKWQEVVSNFVLESGQNSQAGGYTTPYSRTRVYASPRNKVFLRDPETHKLVMTYASKLTRAIYGDKRGEYVQAEPVGYEDVAKARVVTKLLRYAMGLPGHFRTMVEAIVDMALFGTSVVECYWRYDEREILVRGVTTDGISEESQTQRMTVPVYDDVCLRNVDVLDFYPDPSRYRLDEMGGCAKRFKMYAHEAQQLYDSGYYKDYGPSPLPSASADSSVEKQSFRAGLDQPWNRDPFSGFKEMIGYEYWGQVPKELGITDDETGEVITRGRLTLLNQRAVKCQAWPFTDHRLPFYSFIINPVQGRFYGISPAETVRYDQSFADAMKILLAEAVVRQVHPPIAYDSDADFDVAKLREWRADLPIPVRGGPSAIGTLRYDANVANASALLQGIKNEIKEGSGALGAIQGESGPDRESATVGAQRYQMALDRPELAGMILETECLPPLASAILSRYQQFLVDSEDLGKRVGEMPEPVWIGDIMGAFDIRFVGSRNATTPQEKLVAIQTVAQLGTAIPAFQAMMPNLELAQMIVGDILNLPEAAAQIGNPEQMEMNAQLTQAMNPQAGGTGPANNGVPNTPQPVAPIAQIAGSAA